MRALLVAVGLLLLQGPRLLHMLVVAHATCEHGELVELVELAELAERTERTEIQHASDPQLAGPEHDAEQVRVEAAHRDGSGHDHCDSLALRHLPAGIQPAFVAPSELTLAPRAALSARDERRPVPLLALAPKSSPPAG